MDSIGTTIMKSKIVLLTGASSGVGESLAKFLYDRGFFLILISRRKPKIINNINKNKILFFQTDLSNPIKAEKIIDDIIDKYKYIPYVINNAGILSKDNLDNYNWKQIEKDLNINSRMPWYIMKKTLPEMRLRNFGRIINITSGAPLNCFKNFGIYSATKGLLNSFTVTLAKENIDYNIKINLMSPGPVKSEMAPDAEFHPEICHPTFDYLINLSEAGETGKFFWLGYEVPLFPDLKGVQWLKGIGNNKLKKIL